MQLFFVLALSQSERSIDLGSVLRDAVNTLCSQAINTDRSLPQRGVSERAELLY